MSIDFRAALKHYAQGLLMGGADVIPGVSGGTMALIVGIYERLIASISALFSAVLALLRADLDAFRHHFSQVAWSLLIPLGLGIVSALLIGARIIPHLLETYPAQCRALFFGLIAGSLAIPWLRAAHMGAREVLVAIAAAVGAFFLVGLPPNHVADPSLLQVFGAAAVAICAMILPGISGAFLLLVMGMYAPTLLALDQRRMAYVLTFVAGAAVGIGLFSNVLNWLLERHHDLMMAALVGMMAGSLRALWPWLGEDRSLQAPAPGDPVLTVLVLAVLGFAFVTALTWISKRQISHQPAEPAEREA